MKQNNKKKLRHWTTFVVMIKKRGEVKQGKDGHNVSSCGIPSLEHWWKLFLADTLLPSITWPQFMS